jgi:hypothetical protein
MIEKATAPKKTSEPKRKGVCALQKSATASYQVHWNTVFGYGQGPHWEKEPPEKPPDNFIMPFGDDAYAESHEHGTEPEAFSDVASANAAARAKFDVQMGTYYDCMAMDAPEGEEGRSVVTEGTLAVDGLEYTKGRYHRRGREAGRYQIECGSKWRNFQTGEILNDARLDLRFYQDADSDDDCPMDISFRVWVEPA